MCRKWAGCELSYDILSYDAVRVCVVDYFLCLCVFWCVMMIVLTGTVVTSGCDCNVLVDFSFNKK